MNEPRIAYVTPYDDDYKSITTHTNARMHAWRALGAQVERFVVGGGGRASRSAAVNLMVDVGGLGQLRRDLRDYAPTVIYARWLAPVPGQARLMAEIAPLVWEVHADDQTNHVRGSILRRLYLRLFREPQLRAATGATFVISELEQSTSFGSIKGERGVFTNGSWLTPREAPKNLRAKVGLSVGSANSWAGLDRFSSLAAELREEADWIVACPAMATADVSRAVSAPVRVVGTKDSNEYVAELSSWDVAIGTMALERAGFRTASPLKVRDYVGLGIPTILPYWDEGVGNVADPLLLRVVGERDQPAVLDPLQVRDFLQLSRGNNLAGSTSASVSAQEIERRRLEFLVGVAAASA